MSRSVSGTPGRRILTRTNHRRCGSLTGDATEPAPNGYMVTVACYCGVVFMRWVTPEDAVQELALSDLLSSAG